MSTPSPKPAAAPPPDPAPWHTGHLDVGDGHRLYYEQCGKPDGVPALVLHGGPGSGCNPRMRSLLDPQGFRVVLFDQRGCGRSTPRGACAANHTDALVADIERLREHLGIARWLVFGGSWGASLGVAYCARHAGACLGAILRGVFLTGRADIDWFFNGAAALAPRAWQRLAALAPGPRRDALAAWYCEAAGGDDTALAHEAVARWVAWEEALMRADSPPTEGGRPDETALRARLDKYRVQAHYLRHECFIGETELLRRAATIAELPVAILHGCDDRICRTENAVKLAAALPGARLQRVAGAGHSPFDAPMHAALLAAGRHFLARGEFADWPPSSSAGTPGS
ncbi:MAG TPA: prolyl aminopeptidase [Rhodocyclaceae bacterium]|nr:prolyl aminopeptidase [Rhodocyclaceae bacterium]